MEANIKKVDLSSAKQRYLLLTGSSLLITALLFVFSIQLFFKTFGLDERISSVAAVFEKRMISLERKRKFEEVIRKNSSAQFMQRLSKEVQAAQHKKELSLITQFQGFELLKGHESKVIFMDLMDSQWSFEKKETTGVEGFKEVEYQLSEPIYLSDEELKTLLTLIESNNADKPSCFIKNIEIEKKVSNLGKDSYETLFTLVVREKSLSRI